MSSNNVFFDSFVATGVQLAKSTSADAVLIVLDDTTHAQVLKNDEQIGQFKKQSGNFKMIVAGQDKELLARISEHNIATVLMESPETTIHDRITQAILDSIADEHLQPGSIVVALYSGFDVEQFDSISVVKLTEHLGRLTARDLQKLETKVPLDTLRTVVELAVEIGREGREGKPVGTMLVVGDHRQVLEQSQQAGFDPMKGYVRRDRNLSHAKVRESVKEIAQMDGAFVVAGDGTLESACRIIDTAPVELTMTTGLGSRHYSGAAISKNTKAIAVVVSETSGTVRIFQNGEVVLRIEPMRRPMKWKGTSRKLQPQDRQK